MQDDISFKGGRLACMHTSHLATTLLISTADWAAITRLGPNVTTAAMEGLRTWLRQTPTEENATVAFAATGVSRPHTLEIFQPTSYQQHRLGCRGVVLNFNGTAHGQKQLTAENLPQRLASAEKAAQPHGKTTKAMEVKGQRWLYLPDKYDHLLVI